ncbi:hypothetical protein, partial [Faecalicatena fissicatena]
YFLSERFTFHRHKNFYTLNAPEMLFKSTTGAFFMFDLQYGTSNASQADQNRMPSLMYVRLETIYAIRASARASS